MKEKKQIKVQINPSIFIRLSEEYLTQGLMSELKKAGIPIKGTYEYEGLESGNLRSQENFEIGRTEYIWTS